MLARKERYMSYYKPTIVNPNWYSIFTDQIDNGVDPEDVLDQICKLACGIKGGASDYCQQYAKHIHAHLIAAFKTGEHMANQKIHLTKKSK